MKVEEEKKRLVEKKQRIQKELLQYKKLYDPSAWLVALKALELDERSRDAKDPPEVLRPALRNEWSYILADCVKKFKEEERHADAEFSLQYSKENDPASFVAIL